MSDQNSDSDDHICKSEMHVDTQHSLGVWVEVRRRTIASIQIICSFCILASYQSSTYVRCMRTRSSMFIIPLLGRQEECIRREREKEKERQDNAPHFNWPCVPFVRMNACPKLKYKLFIDFISLFVFSFFPFFVSLLFVTEKKKNKIYRKQFIYI